jgi:hypothetical protein
LLQKVQPDIVSVNQTHRIARHRFGIELVVSQTGRIARFSWNALVVNIVSGMGLASMIALIIDALAMFVLPLKSSFYKLKFDTITHHHQPPQPQPQPTTTGRGDDSERTTTNKRKQQ